MISLLLSFYCACVLCCGKWAGGETHSGKYPVAGWTIACDPAIFKSGTYLYIEDVGLRQCEDTGKAIRGHRIDIFVESHQEALTLGKRKAKGWRLRRTPSGSIDWSDIVVGRSTNSTKHKR